MIQLAQENMMVTEYPYKNLKDVLSQIKRLALKDIKFSNGLVSGKDLQSIFYGLRNQIKYKSDPHLIELIQRPRTLMGPNNFHGKPGRGDCDCFTVLGISFATLSFYQYKVAKISYSIFSISKHLG